MINAIDRLIDKIKETNNPTVIGLDPNYEMITDHIKKKYDEDLEGVSKAIIAVSYTHLHTSLESLEKIMTKKYKNIIFLVLDGMGEHILNNISPNGFFNKQKIDCVTSVYPSTTTAALTTYYSRKTTI